MSVDDKFYERADAHIVLSNEQLNQIGSGKVAESMMFALARFNSWISAGGYKSAEEMAEERAIIIEYFTTKYKSMLEENVDDYIANFDKYMDADKEKS